MQLKINFASRHHQQERIMIWSFRVLTVVLLGILFLQGRHYLDSRRVQQGYEKRIASLQEQLQGTLPQRLSAAELTARLAQLEQARTLLQRDSFRWTRLFDRMEQLLPEGVRFRSFNPNYEQNTLVMTGVAKDLVSLQELLDNLHSGEFEQAYLLSQGEVDVDNGRGGKTTALSFSINLAGVF